MHGLRQTGTCVLVMDFTYKIASAGQDCNNTSVSNLFPGLPLAIDPSQSCAALPIFCLRTSTGMTGEPYTETVPVSCIWGPKEDMESVAAGIVTTLERLRECGCAARPRLKTVVLDGAGISAVKQAEGALMPMFRWPANSRKLPREVAGGLSGAHLLLLQSPASLQSLASLGRICLQTVLAKSNRCNSVSLRI